MNRMKLLPVTLELVGMASIGGVIWGKFIRGGRP